MINVPSVHQIVPRPNDLGSSVSKGVQQNLTRTLALEFAIFVDGGLTLHADFREPWSSE